MGDIFVDVVAKVRGLPAWDSDTEAEYIKVLPGGSALNQARHLQALGWPVHFFGALGNDAFGAMLTNHVQSQGFSMEYVKVFDELPSSACLVLAGPSDRAFVSCYSTTDAYSTADLKASSAALERCGHIHIGGYFNLKGLQNPDFTEVIRKCRSEGKTISLNTQYDQSESWLGEGGHLRELLPLTDLLFVNSVEAEKISAAVLSEKDGPQALCDAFPDLLVVVTRGSEGCRIFAAGRPPLNIPTTPASYVADATGAGDAFLAGFLSVWLSHGTKADGEVQQAAALRGNAVARICVGRVGACVTPVSADDLE